MVETDNITSAPSVIYGLRLSFDAYKFAPRSGRATSKKVYCLNGGYGLCDKGARNQDRQSQLGRTAIAATYMQRC